MCSPALDAADELHDLTGISATELVAFRARRLVLHELLVRISADYAVPDGSRIEDLGINFRQMAGRVLEHWIEPAMAGIEAEYARLRQRAGRITQAALGQRCWQHVGALRIRGDPGRDCLPAFAPRRARSRSTCAGARSAMWRASRNSSSAHDQARMNSSARCYRALARVSSALFNRHGGGWGARSGLIGPLAADLACNEVGGDCIGRTVDALLERAAVDEGFYRLPPQQRPIVMNTKGPSAAGKSSLRPLQKTLAGDDWRALDAILR